MSLGFKPSGLKRSSLPVVISNDLHSLILVNETSVCNVVGGQLL